MFKEVMTSASFYQMFCAPKWKYSRSLFWWHVISDPPVTCHVTDTRIVIDRCINHLHLYRWICKEPFYMACSKCSGASFFFFFHFSLASSVPWDLGFCSFWLWRHTSAMFHHLPEVKLRSMTSLHLCRKIYSHVLTERGDTVYTKRSTSLNSQGVRRCFTGFTSPKIQI